VVQEMKVSLNSLC